MQFTVIDNFLPDQLSNRLYDLIVTKKLVSLYPLPVSALYYENVNKDLFQETSAYSRMLARGNALECELAREIVSTLISEISEKIKVRFAVSSIRINYMNRSCAEPTLKYDVPHVDINKIEGNMYTLMYYLNDSDGDTILYKETCRGTFYMNEVPKSLTCLSRIPPRRNRIAIFKANTLHSAPACCSQDRYVINLNITTEFPIL